MSKAEIEDAEIRKKVNHILIAKLAISKYKYGKCKNLALTFEVELKMRGGGGERERERFCFILNKHSLGNIKPATDLLEMHDMILSIP